MSLNEAANSIYIRSKTYKSVKTNPYFVDITTQDLTLISQASSNVLLPHCFLFHWLGALCQNFCLVSNFPQSRQHFFIPFTKPINRILQSNFFAKINNIWLGFTEIVTRQSRKQMVDCLKLQSSMNVIKPLWTINIHSGT